MTVLKTAFALLLVAQMAGCALTPSAEETAPTTSLRAPSPLDATYLFDGDRITLEHGTASVETAPGAASRTEFKVLGAAVGGDLNGDGHEDAALLLTQTTGGSGTFYYVATALNRDGGYEGHRAVFIGDRISPQNLMIRHGLVIVDYLDRQPGAAMAATPSRERSLYLLHDNLGLRQVPLADDELLIAGDVVIGHEVRAVQPCGEPAALWLTGTSPALLAVQAAYHLATSDAPPYTPLLMIVTGTLEDRPADGFGADYVAAVRVNRVIKVSPGKTCANGRPSP